jgi:hypothetical protein
VIASAYASNGIMEWWNIGSNILEHWKTGMTGKNFFWY